MEAPVPAQLQQRYEELLRLTVGGTAGGVKDTPSKLGLDCLVDSFLALFDECQHDSLSRHKNIAAFLKKYNAAVKKTKELQVKVSDFEVKATVGRGHFGEVQVVHEKTTDMVYAMKVLRKSDLLLQPDISFFEEERDIMANCSSQWLTKLHFAFQDSTNLYLVMDFHPGGDLLSLLSRQGDKLDEDMARFYLAEIAVAINDLHQMGYLHRDIKPENVLIDHSGHIKLADFGSAAKMNSRKQVSSRMPVGTPDYVAPELLDSMNRASQHQCYGVEVDWWSLGICAYEMLYGAPPFTDDQGSMVATYGNIMNFKKKLKFSAQGDISSQAKDLITQLLSHHENRLQWSELQKHPFFKGVAWNNIRNTEPPYIPTISSLDDTSNFDEVEKLAAPPNLDSFQPSARDFSGRHLPFVGFSYFRTADTEKGKQPKSSLSNSTVLSELDSSVGLNTARYLTPVDSSTSLPSPSRSTSDMEVTVTVTTAELQDLRTRCQRLEKRVEVMGAEKAAVDRELQNYVTSNQALQQQLDQEKDKSTSNDSDSVQALRDLQAMNSQISHLQDEMLSFQLDELREIIVQLETEQEALTRRLMEKDRRLESLQQSLTTAQQQLASKQMKLDRERRKSREGQKQNLALFESHEESWMKQLEEKQATIDDLTRKFRDMVDLVEAYEDQEEQQAGELQQLHYKLNTSLLPTGGIDTSDIDLDGSRTARMQVNPASDQERKRVSLHVTLRPGRQSIRDNKTVEKLKELQTVVDKYSNEAQRWRRREEELQKKIAKVEGELKSQRQKEGVSQQTKESLVTKVHVYQQEVHMQRKLIQELQKKMRSYLDEQTSISQTEAKLKELQCQNLDLEGELFTVRQETEKTRQNAMDMTREMEEIIAKLEVAQKQAKEYQDKYSKEVENTEIKTQELEEEVKSLNMQRQGLESQVKSLLDQVESLQGLVDEANSQTASLTERNTQIQRQLQEVTQRNAELMKQVESMQKVHEEENSVTASRLELTSQMNRLQQHNDDLQHQLTLSQRERRDLEDKTLTLQRDAERLNRRVARLEGVESEKRQLESRLERMGSLEREKKRLELKLSRLEELEKDKTHLQLKVDRLEMDIKGLQMEVKEAREEKREASRKYQELSDKQQRLQPSPSSRQLRMDLLRSEKEELERQVKELKHLNLSTKELKDEAKVREVEVVDLTAKVKALEEETQEAKAKAKAAGDLSVKVRTLEIQVKEGERAAKEASDLRMKVRSLENQVRDSERNQKEVSDFRAKIKSLESQVDDRKEKVKDREEEVDDLKAQVNDLKAQVKSLEEQVKASERTVSGVGDLKVTIRTLEDRGKEKCASSSELRDLKSQLQQKNTCIQRLEQEKGDLEKQLSAAEKNKSNITRTPSLEGQGQGRSRLVERLQAEKAELQRQVQRLEMVRDSNLRHLAVPDRLRDQCSRDSCSRDSLAVLRRDSGGRIRAELEDKVQRLERVVSQLERKLEISSASSVDKQTLKREIEQLRQQIKEAAMAEEDSVPQSEYSSLKDKVQDLQTKVEQLQEEKAGLEKAAAQARDLEARQGELEERVKAMEGDKASLQDQLRQLRQQHLKVEEELKKAKEDGEKGRGVARSASASGNNRLVGELTQEKHALEAKVKSLERQLESLQKRRQSTDHKSQANTELQNEKAELDKQVSALTADVKTLKEEKATCQKILSEAEARAESSALQVKDLMSDASRLRQQVSELEAAARSQEAAQSQREMADSDDAQRAELSKTNAYLQTKVSELERHLEQANTRPSSTNTAMSKNALVAELRQELHLSNLAVSEARSLLAANQRQEKELRDRIDKLQRVLDNGAISRANSIQMAAGAEHELRVLRSQYETLQRQYKNQEDRQTGSHRDKAATVMEITLLKDQLQTKQCQLDAEMKKSQKLAALCIELEDQVTDMEAIIADSENKETQFSDIRQTYETAVQEREKELEETNQKLNSLTTARTSMDSRVKELSHELQAVKSQHTSDVAHLQRQVQEEKARAQHLTAKMSKFEEKERQYQQMVEVQGQNIQAESAVINQLKEEISSKITEIQDLKATNIKLNKHLGQAMDKFELIFGEKVSLENFNEALQGLHFLEKYKFESTIGQQMKLIDYLQELYMENAGKKKKGVKRFGSAKGKEGMAIPGLPLQWTDLQTALEQEQKKTARLQEQLDRLREDNFTQANELLKLKTPLKERVDNTSQRMTPRVQKAAVATLLRSPSAQTPAPPRQSRRRGYQVPVQPTPQRMHHNIPHRFVTGLNTRATKCGLCLGSVHFVKQASKCQECGMVVHPKCSSSVPATCGLPTEYVRHFADMMSRIEEAELHSSAEPLNIKMEGWLKVPRTGKSGWEKRWVELDGSYLMLYREDTDANPVDTFDLSPPDAEVSVHSAVTAAELTNTASLDLYYVLRLDQDPLTTCWPGRYLYLMTTNFNEKQRWVAALEAAVRSMQRQDRLSKNEPQMTTVVSLKESDRKEFNCALALSPSIVLLGTDDGLFALNPQSTSGRQHLVQLSGFGSVHQMAEAKGVNLVLLLTGPERRLVMVESKLIKCRMSQTVGGETTPFTFRAVEGVQSCTVFSVAVWADASYLCVGTPDKVLLLKYNPSLAMYCIRKEMPSNQPCSCMCIAESFAIVGTERFYRISLEHPSLIDFVDRQDSSLAFAAFGAANHHSFPLAVVLVSPEGLPLEFLLCFHEFGVFVDHRGQRSRQSDIKWSGLPLSFSYTEPFLYITYFNSLQATVVPTDKDQVKGCQTAVDLPAPRNLGRAEEGGAIYVATSSNGITEVLLLQACDQRQILVDSDDEKENTARQVRFAPSPDKGHGGGFTVKTSVSLLSLDSISSSNTMSSVESTL